jgi:pseudouridine synthase
MRLQRFLAIAGVASRRRGEQLIADGRVAVNGKIVRKPGSTVEPERDIVEVDGERIETEEKVYVLLNKPGGYLSAVTDARGRPTVSELTAGLPARLYPVGRLDMDTEGALLMTNDGELCHRLTHPKFGVEKTYHATVRGKPSNAALLKLRKGIDIGEGKTSPARVRLLGAKGSLSRIEITVHEGRKRQIKRMCKTIGHPVARLRRIEFAGMRLGRLKPGEYRQLSRAEVAKLKQMAHIGPE